MGKEILRPADLAAALGVTTGCVYRMIAGGEIPAVRTGRSLQIPRAAWEAWLARQRDEAVRAGAARKEAN